MKREIHRNYFAGFICVLLALTFRPACAEEREKFSAEVEKPLAELENKAVELKSTALMEELKKTITEIADSIKLGDDVKKRLEAEAKGVVDRSLVEWKDKLDSRLRPFLRQDIKESLELMTQWPAEMLIKSGFVPESGKLTDQEDWKNTLKKVITPEQLAATEKKEQDREQAKEKELQDQLKPLLEKMRKNQELVFKAEAGDVKAVLGLTGDRAKKLEDLAGVAAKCNADAIEKRWIEKQRGMNDQMRARIAMGRGNRITSLDDGAESSPDLENWKKTLKEFLSEEEQKHWETAAASRKNNRDRAMAMMFISQMDSAVFFTASQREKLEPLAVKAMAKIMGGNTENFSASVSYGSNFTQEELKTILDEKQMLHWKEASEGIRGHGEGEDDAGNNDKAGADEIASDGEEDKEIILSTYLHNRDKAQRNRLAKGVRVKLEDIQRVVKLSEESTSRLEIASRGAAEHALDFWRPNFENWVRSSLRSADAKTLRQRLATLNRDINFGEQGSSFNQPIWTNAVADVLTDAQMELWMNEVNGRKSYHDRARVLMILSELDRRFHLSLDQFQKLEPLLAEAVKEYATDFNRMFGGSGEMPRYMIVLLAGVPESKTKSILTPEQFEQWQNTDSQQFKSWWENIKSSHDSRNKRVK